MKKKKRKRKSIEPRTPYTALHENFILDQAGCLLCPLFKFCVKHIEDYPEYDCKSKKWQKADHVVNSHCIPPRIRNKNKDGSVDVLFIGEAPGYNEDIKGKVFVGKAGQELDKYLELYKIKSYAIDNVLRCRPPNNDTPTYTVAKLCSPFLAETIKRLQPKVIVPMGTPAMQMVTANQHARIMKSVGRVSTVTMFKEKQTFPIFPIFHPSFILRQPHRQEEYVSLFHRLRLFLDSPERFRGTDDFNIIVVHDDKTLKKAKKKLAKIKEGVVAFDVETTDLSAHFVKASEKLKVRTPSKILSIGFAFDNESAISFLLSHDHVHIDVINEAKAISIDILTNKKFKKIAHNLKFDYEYVQKLWGIRIKAAIGDTMLMHYAGVKEDKGTHGLKHLSAEYLNIQEYETEVTSQARDERQHKRVVNFENVDPIILGKYNAMDVIVTYQLYHALKILMKEREKELRKMKYRGNKKQLVKVLVKAAKTIADMEMSGMYIDTEAGKMLQKYYEVLKNEAEFKLLHHPKVVKFKKMLREKYGIKKSGVNKGDVKMEFKINSPKQLTELLFSDVYFGLTPVAPTGTGEKWIKNKLGLSRVGIQEFLEVRDEMPIQYMSTDKEAFEEIKAMQKSNKGGIKILTHIDDYKGHAKLLSTYILPFMERARTCRGKMHSTFNLHITDTGRLSSEKPNFQQIPSIHGINVKRMITSRWKDKGVIVSVDYSQIELRLLAIFSGDKGMLTSYKNDEDLHKKTALGITNKTLAQYNALEKAMQKKWRIVAKRVNFGIAYGIGGDGIVRNLNKEGIRLSNSKDPLEAREQSIIKARKYIKTFYTLYPEAKEYIDDTQEFVERYGYIASIFGRTRNLPEVWSTDNEEASRALRQAVNFTIQSAASDIMLTSLILVNKIVKKRFKKDVKIIASIHDAIDFDAKIDVVPDLLETVVEVMENVPKYAEKVWGKDFDWGWFYTIPIYADVEVGVNWRDCIELNDLPKKYKNAPLDKKVEVAIELSRGLQHKYDEEMKGMK